MHNLKIDKLELGVIYNVVLEQGHNLRINKNILNNFGVKGFLEFKLVDDYWVFESSENECLYLGSIFIEDKIIYVQRKVDKNDNLTAFFPKSVFLRLHHSNKLKVVLPKNEYKVETKPSQIQTHLKHFAEDELVVYEVTFDHANKHANGTLIFRSKDVSYSVNLLFDKHITAKIINLDLPFCREISIKEMPWAFPECNEWNYKKYARQKNN